MGHPQEDRIRTLVSLFPLFLLLLLTVPLVLAGCAASNQAAVVPDAAGSTAPDEYVIGPEDVLEISVWQNEDVSRVVSVRPDGKVSLPLLHDVQAEEKKGKALQGDICCLAFSPGVLPLLPATR